MAQNSYYFYSDIARRALKDMEGKAGRTEISVDLNLSCSSFEISDDELILDGENRLAKEDLRRIAKKENRIFLFEDGALEILEHRGHDYYKLVPTDRAPLLEISGVKMHISKGTDPFESAGKMAEQVVKKGHRVLDTCSGLGYAASSALKIGASEVVSVELSPTVMELRRKNPWSQRIFGDGIELVNANIFEYIRELPTGYFDSVIHDPPRFSLAGELYGEEFYGEIFRVLRKRGALFHYTGNPHMVKRGSGFVDNAAQRLRKVGFKKVLKNAELMGVTALK